MFKTMLNYVPHKSLCLALNLRKLQSQVKTLMQSEFKGGNGRQLMILSHQRLVKHKQRCAFLKMIATYFAASPKVAGCEQREASHCKQRWQKINDLVNKFCGSYEAASREKSSSQNENDVLRVNHALRME
ncbi:hypothetical protein F2Q70_00003646 [Brassica cretica]|uniref:Uncharacterized protein n=2 Tax=Brassica cretica TaxID=69181 RepID=A0A8S9FNF6_BRACR|nr:hypothetical protein F2Q68_00021022 [Brassica cretica]KAF2576651.1 hypothetical protein F2Q70_00003646 [Brassica cretica]KAF3561054.1 hypothetical protein DY000_02015543 [Brassica cretica]